MIEVGGKVRRKEDRLVGVNRIRRRAARTGVRPAHRPADRTPPALGNKADDILWDVAGVAAYLHVPISAVYKMTARKAAVCIPHIRLGGKLRFKRTDVERWLTLLTVSNLKTLAKVRQKVSKVVHGNDSQTTAGEW